MNYPPKIQAYISQIQENKIITTELRIIERLMAGSQTLEMLVIATGKPLQTISARVSGLQDRGIIRAIHNPISKHSIFTLVKDENEQEKLAQHRFEEKRIAWIKRGEKQGFV